MITYSHRRSRGPMSLTRLPLIALCWERWNERETASIPAVLGETKPAAWWKHQQQGHRERGRDHRARFVNKHELCALMMSRWRRHKRATTVGDFNFLSLSKACKAFKFSFSWVRLINDLSRLQRKICDFKEHNHNTADSYFSGTCMQAAWMQPQSDFLHMQILFSFDLNK